MWSSGIRDAGLAIRIVTITKSDTSRKNHCRKNDHGDPFGQCRSPKCCWKRDSIVVYGPLPIPGYLRDVEAVRTGNIIACFCRDYKL